MFLDADESQLSFFAYYAISQLQNEGSFPFCMI